jgi:hypothetical protein
VIRLVQRWWRRAFVRAPEPPAPEPAPEPRVDHRVSIQTWVNCACGSLDTIYLPTISSRGTCKRCGRTWGIRSLNYQRETPGQTSPLHVVLGAYVDQQRLVYMPTPKRIS